MVATTAAIAPAVSAAPSDDSGRVADPVHQYQLVARGYQPESLPHADDDNDASDADEGGDASDAGDAGHAGHAGDAGHAGHAGHASTSNDGPPPAASNGPLLYRRDRPGGLLARWSGPHDQRVALVRVDGPARRARRENSDFVRRFERGLERGLRDVRRKRRRLDKVGAVPVLELQLEYTDAAGTRIWSATRTLFLKPYTLTLAVTAPAGSPARRARRQVRSLLRSFRPYTGS